MSFVEDLFNDPFHGVDQAIPDTFSVDLNGDSIPDFEWSCTGNSPIPNEFRFNLDGDRFAEVVLAIDVNQYGELVLVGKGDVTGDNKYDIAVAELNGDWWPDLVVTNPNNNTSFPSVTPTSLIGIETVLTVETGLDAWVEIEETMLEIPLDKPGNPSFYMAVESEQPVVAETPKTSAIAELQSTLNVWHLQGSEDTCAICSQEFVLEELLGIDFSENDLVAQAIELGIYAPGNGTLWADVGKLLEHFGLDVDRKTGATLQELANSLANGSKLIVGIDSSEIWGNDSEDLWEHLLGIPGTDANHAVQVVAIDFENKQVVLNDSGHPDGRGELIPLDRFVDAWQDSQNFVCIANRIA